MFDMQSAWWELMLRGLLIYAALFLMVRMSSKRTVGQFSPFDLLVFVLLAQAVAGSLTGGDESVQGGLLVAATLLGLNVLTDVATTYSRKAEQLLEGHEVLLGRNGRIFDDVLKKNLITRSAIEAAMRQADIELDELGAAILEADGTISVLKKKSSSPPTPPALRQLRKRARHGRRHRKLFGHRNVARLRAEQV